jgi:hypothetical protein
MWRRILRNFLDDSIVEHKSRPPLRWIANWAGSIASKNMLELSYMEDEGLDKGFRYKYYGWLWDTFWPIYSKYGTFYRLNMDMSGPGWDDYDENGVPYWEKTGTIDPDYDYDEFHWDYIDEETGDAFKVINFGGKE